MLSREINNNFGGIITPEQCRAARGFLGWSQDELAKKVNVIKGTIGDFERKKTVPLVKTLVDIRAVFEEAGIRFEDNDKEYCVKLLKNPK